MVYVNAATAQKLKALADSQKRKVSETIEVLIESYEKASK